MNVSTRYAMNNAPYSTSPGFWRAESAKYRLPNNVAMNAIPENPPISGNKSSFG
jgi:hypothetical protein